MNLLDKIRESFPILPFEENIDRTLKHCKKFYSEEGCHFGDDSPTSPLAPQLLPAAEPDATVKPLNWRTRNCTKWEYSGYCKFGSKWVFAHGDAANVPITPHDSPLPGGYIPRSDEGRLKLQELMTMCTKLSKQVLDLEKEKDAQAVEILRLKKRVKRLERQRKSSTSQPRRRKYGQSGDSKNHFIGECSKPPKNTDQRAFIRGVWSDNGEDEVEKTRDEACLVAQAPDEICLGVNLEPDEWIKDSGCSKHMTEDSKPMKTPMSTEPTLNGVGIGESVDNTTIEAMIEDPKTSHLEAVKHIFRYIKGTMHLGLWYPKGSGIEIIVYAGDYVDCKSTSGVCTFMGCFLTSWFSKKQTAFAISITEAEYVTAGKACPQALWMKQALIDYGIRLDNIPIMCANKEAIDLK
ncbi:copia protein [Tanacetum coccineum]